MIRRCVLRQEKCHKLSAFDSVWEASEGFAPPATLDSVPAYDLLEMWQTPAPQDLSPRTSYPLGVHSSHAPLCLQTASYDLAAAAAAAARTDPRSHSQKGACCTLKWGHCSQKQKCCSWGQVLNSQREVHCNRGPVPLASFLSSFLHSDTIYTLHLAGQERRYPE